MKREDLLSKIGVGTCIWLCGLAVLSIICSVWMGIKKEEKQPTEVQVRIHEGIMDSYAVKEVNPFWVTMDELVSERFKK